MERRSRVYRNPGDYGFIAQLNEAMNIKKRPTEFRVDKFLQPFDENKFNFTMIGQEEVLFQFGASERSEVQFFPNAPIYIENSPRVLAINRIDHESILLAFLVAVEAGNPYFRVGYNSLGAFATINHLQFQAYYLAAPFPIQRTPSKKMITMKIGVKISDILNYPVRGLVFEGGNMLEYLSNAVSDVCICLQENIVPYNVLIADSGTRIFFFPQCYAEKHASGEVIYELLDTQVNPAVWEISGHMVLKRKKDYEEASSENVWRLLAEVSLSEESFKEVKELIFESICCCTHKAKVIAEILSVAPPSHENEEVLEGTAHPDMVSVKQKPLVPRSDKFPTEIEIETCLNIRCSLLEWSFKQVYV